MIKTTLRNSKQEIQHYYIPNLIMKCSNQDNMVLPIWYHLVAQIKKSRNTSIHIWTTNFLENVIQLRKDSFSTSSAETVIYSHV